MYRLQKDCSRHCWPRLRRRDLACPYDWIVPIDDNLALVNDFATRLAGSTLGRRRTFDCTLPPVVRMSGSPLHMDLSLRCMDCIRLTGNWVGQVFEAWNQRQRLGSASRLVRTDV